MKKFGFAKRFLIQNIDARGDVERPVMVVKLSLWEKYGIPSTLFLAGLALGWLWGYMQS